MLLFQNQFLLYAKEMIVTYIYHSYASGKAANSYNYSKISTTIFLYPCLGTNLLHYCALVSTVTYVTVIIYCMFWLECFVIGTLCVCVIHLRNFDYTSLGCDANTKVYDFIYFMTPRE